MHHSPFFLPTTNNLLFFHHLRLQSLLMEQRVEDAVDAYLRGEFKSIRSAAKAFGAVPTTVSRRLRGTRTRRQARVPTQLLSTTQEDMLVRWILDLERAGNAPNHALVREMASLISRVSGGPQSLGQNWVQRFLKRHPEIHTKVGVKIESLRI
jgi:hypothetical protein